MSKRETLNIGSVEDLMNKNDDMIRSIRHINDHMKQETGLQRKAIIKTYGCQVNRVNTKILRGSCKWMSRRLCLVSLLN